MIITEIFYGLKCDRCGELYTDGEHSFWNDESNVIENSYESDWNELKGKYYCPDCHEVDDETDEVKVYEEYPEHLKTLNKFIDGVMRGYNRSIGENENEFTVKFRLYKSSHLKDFEEKFISELLGQKLISISREIGKYNDYTNVIRFKK